MATPRSAKTPLGGPLFLRFLQKGWGLFFASRVSHPLWIFKGRAETPYPMLASNMA